MEPHQFAAIGVEGADGHPALLGLEASKALCEHLRAAGLIDAHGRVQDSLRLALKAATLTIPDEFADQADQVAAILRDAPPIAATRLQWTKANLTIGKAGVETEERPGAGIPVVLREHDIELPDLLTELQDRNGPVFQSAQITLQPTGA